jgi:hypothetical protein
MAAMRTIATSEAARALIALLGSTEGVSLYPHIRGAESYPPKNGVEFETPADAHAFVQAIAKRHRRGVRNLMNYRRGGFQTTAKAAQRAGQAK